MDTKIINAQNAPAAVGPYCHAVEAGDFVFTSGQIGLDPQTQELKEGVAAQTKQVLANLGAVLKASDLTLDNVIKTTVFLADINDFAEINEIYEEAFGDNKPARSCVQACLPVIYNFTPHTHKLLLALQRLRDTRAGAFSFKRRVPFFNHNTAPGALFGSGHFRALPLCRTQTGHTTHTESAVFESLPRTGKAPSLQR